MAIDVEQARVDFNDIKQKHSGRNAEYHLLRQAVQGNFRWPRDWPAHIPKVRHNLCKPITERFVTYLMGKGFSFNLERPNNLEYREAAERTEKILQRLFDLSKASLQFDMGAKDGSQLGRTVFRVYRKGPEGKQHACFHRCQPDYFYGVPAGDPALSEFAMVFYSYPMDISEVRKMYGDRKYLTEDVGNRGRYFDPLPEEYSLGVVQRSRRVPVLEVWTQNDYLLIVGDQTIYNGPNPFVWSDTGEGFIPFVVVENIRNAGVGYGESDISQAVSLNEQYNYLLSRKHNLVSRYLTPTLVWEGAPQNYAETLTATIGGGGALPVRVGAKLYFLAYDKPNPMITELEATLRTAILESAGLSELALQGTVSQSVTTGTALAAQFQPVLSTIEKKRMEWTWGLQLLAAMLLNEQERIGDSKVLGQAVINQSVKSQDPSMADGELVDLSGKDIMGLRTIEVEWPGVLPKDDEMATRLEMEKAAQGIQSIYTTLEKLGVKYPYDEISRIRMENTDPNLKGQAVAEQMRAAAPIITKQMELDAQGMGGASGAPPAEMEDDWETPTEEELLAQGDLGARIREANRRSKPEMGEADTGEPAIMSGF